MNLRHLVAQQENAPWTGYYTDLDGAKLAVSNAYGVWFEIRRRENTWEAFQVVCDKLKLAHNALKGIDALALYKSGEPTNEELAEEIRAS
jgi:hypothetical protein